MKRIASLTLVVVAIIALFSAGCSQNEIEENQVYVVSDDRHFQEDADILNIEGRIPFQKYKGKNLEKYCDAHQVLLTVAPDGEEIYLMEKSLTGSSSGVIFGDPTETVKIVRKNINTLEQETILDSFPFVSNVSWNSEGNMVAFGGGEKLAIYDVKSNSILMEEMLSQETISHFYWSPDSKDKIYTEQPELANASIYYLSSQRKVEAYETREETYYKGRLDNEYYYGTKWDFTTGQIETVILDKQRKVIKTLTPGRFRDAYQKSLLVVNDHGFGLNYIKDINHADQVIPLTNEYVYDVKFVVDGKIAYTTKAQDMEANTFYLYIVSSDGNQLKRFKVEGGSIALSPDGTVGYINGPTWQRVNFVEHTLDEDRNIGPGTDNELDNLFTAIRGGMLTYYDYQLQGKQDWVNLEKYFINTENPAQWAYFDMKNIFQQKIDKAPVKRYALKIEAKDYDIDPAGGQATVNIRVGTRNIHGNGKVVDYTLQLIRSDNRWYITGFSTFPDAEERQVIEDTVQEIVKDIQLGNTLYDELKGKPIKIGQIQFWTKGINYFAPMVENADAVKVFLYTDGFNEEEVYKLVLEKTEQLDWKFSKLTREELSTL